MIIDRHRYAIKSIKDCGWCREEVKKVCNANGEKVGKQLCIGEKNQLLNEYYLLKHCVTLIGQRKKWRNKGGIFAKKKEVKNTCSIKYLVEEAWGMGPKYVLCLLKHIRNVVVGSDVNKDIMDTMLSVPATDEYYEKDHVNLINSLKVATKFFNPAQIYAIHTSRQKTYNGGKFKQTYKKGSKDLAYSTRMSVLIKGYTNICGDDTIYWESKSREWLVQHPVI